MCHVYFSSSSSVAKNVCPLNISISPSGSPTKFIANKVPSIVPPTRMRSSITSFRGAVAVVRATNLTRRQRPEADVFDAAHYPCYVISITNLLKLDTFCHHEEALERGLLEVLETVDEKRDSCFFVSQNWESTDDPDNARGTKLRWLKNLKEHYQEDQELYIWIDILSVPQRDRTNQLLALESLCYYSQLCSRFVPLVRDVDAWQKLYGEDIRREDGTGAGCFDTYLSRGWCRVEMCAALAPRRVKSGHWHPGPREVNVRYHHDPESPGHTNYLVTTHNLRNPLAGCFSSEDDRISLAPMVAAVALRFRQHTANIRPLWLKILDGPRAAFDDFSSEQKNKKQKLDTTVVELEEGGPVVTDSEESFTGFSLPDVDLESDDEAHEPAFVVPREIGKSNRNFNV